MKPYNINKILVPVDLSDYSLNALNIGVHIGKRHKAEVVVLNIREPSYTELEEASNLMDMKVSADVINALLGTICRATGIMPALYQKEGLPLDAIIKTSRSGSFDLIVMGTHGASGDREGFIGSNTYNVIKHASCPVLSVPVTQTSPLFKKVLFPIRPVSGGLKRMDIVCHFLSGNASVDVLGLFNSKGEKVDGILNKIVGEVDQDLSENKIKFQTNWAEGSTIVEDILQFAQKNLSDLIVLTSGIDAMSKVNYIGPHAQKLLNLSNVPILSMKHPGLPILV